MFKLGSIYMFRVPEDAELVSYLAKFAKEKAIKVGKIDGIGALKSCTIGFYDQQEQKYEYIRIEEEVEMANMSGNISVKEGEPFVHVHAVVGRRDGSTYSGHLVEAKVFVAEVLVAELIGDKELLRERYGGLWLWKPGIPES